MESIRAIIQGRSTRGVDLKGRQLFEAAGSRNLTGVIVALEKGADVNWKKEDELLKVIGMLWPSFWRANLANKNGTSPMHAAALQGHRDIVALLLDRDGNRNLAEKEGGISLHYAAKHGHCAVVALLLERGADPNLADM
eukprot:gene35493-45998_t